ncbi:MAG: MBL fold metallo-hydrolase [Methanomicrobiaceae archaeon]|nr:MBL fold metallo-hydrolase [Methanomicrobiaceae archaeon]
MQVHWIPGEQFLANSYVYGQVLVEAGALPMAVERFRAEIDTIVLTHCHYDHIAHLAEIAHMCSATVYIHPEDAHGLNDARMNLSIHFGARLPPGGPATPLREGAMVGPLRVIHTPGHTPGSICLYDPDERILFSGDTVFSDGGFGRTDFPGGSMEELGRSLEKLAGLDVRGLYPGHGVPIESGAERHIRLACKMAASWL